MSAVCLALKVRIVGSGHPLSRNITVGIPAAWAAWDTYSMCSHRRRHKLNGRNESKDQPSLFCCRFHSCVLKIKKMCFLKSLSYNKSDGDVLFCIFWTMKVIRHLISVAYHLLFYCGFFVVVVTSPCLLPLLTCLEWQVVVNSVYYFRGDLLKTFFAYFS